MATTTTTTASSWLSTHWTWILSHLLLVGVLAGLTFGGVYFVEGRIADHDKATAQHYAQIQAADDARAKSLEDRLTVSDAQHALEAQQYQAQITADQQAMKQRDDLLVSVIAKMQIYTPAQVQADLQPKLRAGTATVLADGIKLDTEAARDVDEQITEGTNAKLNLASSQADLTKETTIASNATADLATAKQAITAEQTKNVNQVKSCNAQIAVVKAEARKTGIKAFLAGFISGFLVRVATVK